jgi:hypothetical protein
VVGEAIARRGRKGVRGIFFLVWRGNGWDKCKLTWLGK